MKNNVFSTPVSNLEPNSESCGLSEVSEGHHSMGERVTSGNKLLTPSPTKEVCSVAVMAWVSYFGPCEIVGEFFFQ